MVRYPLAINENVVLNGANAIKGRIKHIFECGRDQYWVSVEQYDEITTDKGTTYWVLTKDEETIYSIGQIKARTQIADRKDLVVSRSPNAPFPSAGGQGICCKKMRVSSADFAEHKHYQFHGPNLENTAIIQQTRLLRFYQQTEITLDLQIDELTEEAQTLKEEAQSLKEEIARLKAELAQKSNESNKDQQQLIGHWQMAHRMAVEDKQKVEAKLAREREKVKQYMAQIDAEEKKVYNVQKI